MAPSAGQPAFELRSVTKSFGDTIANDSIDLRVEVGEIRGLVGENGAGKTTLMGVLYGLHRPDTGVIQVAGRRRRFRSPLDAIAAGLGMVHQHFMLFAELSVAENVIFGDEPAKLGFQNRKAAEQRVSELASKHGLDVDPRARVADLPVGVRQRVEILKALYRRAEVLILDEPTSVLSPNERRALMAVLGRLADENTTVVLISHKLPEVLDICHRITVLRAGRVVETVDATETDAEELSRWMVGKSVVESATREHERGAPVLELAALRIDKASGHSSVSIDELAVHAGEIVGIAGVAGNGQRALAEAVVGVRPTVRGEIRLAGRDLASRTVRARRRAGLAYIPQDRDGIGLALSASVSDNLVMGREGEPSLSPRGRLDHRAIRQYAQALVGNYDVRLGSVEDPASSLSGGNRQKLVVARELAHGARVLIVEQPTRGVDLGARSLIHQELLDFSADGGAVLLISTELDELMRLCDRIFVMLGGRLVGELEHDVATEERLGQLMTGAV